MSANNEENYAILEAAIKCILAKWTTLNDIVEKGFGGPDSYYLRFEMEDDLLYNIKERWNSTGEKSKIYADEIQDFLNEELEENFSTICDDNAPREIGDLIVQFYNECYQGDIKNANDYLDKNFGILTIKLVFSIPLEEASKQIEKLASFIGNSCLEEDGDEDMDDDSSCSSEEEEEETKPKKKKNQPDEDGWITV